MKTTVGKIVLKLLVIKFRIYFYFDNILNIIFHLLLTVYVFFIGIYLGEILSISKSSTLELKIIISTLCFLFILFEFIPKYKIRSNYLDILYPLTSFQVLRVIFFVELLSLKLLLFLVFWGGILYAGNASLLSLLLASCLILLESISIYLIIKTLSEFKINRVKLIYGSLLFITYLLYLGIFHNKYSELTLLITLLFSFFTLYWQQKNIQIQKTENYILQNFKLRSKFLRLLSSKSNFYIPFTTTLILKICFLTMINYFLFPMISERNNFSYTYIYMIASIFLIPVSIITVFSNFWGYFEEVYLNINFRGNVSKSKTTYFFFMFWFVFILIDGLITTFFLFPHHEFKLYLIYLFGVINSFSLTFYTSLFNYKTINKEFQIGKSSNDFVVFALLFLSTISSYLIINYNYFWLYILLFIIQLIPFTYSMLVFNPNNRTILRKIINHQI